MKITALTLALVAGAACGQIVVEYRNDFTATEGQTGIEFAESIGLESAGNGDEGAGYFDAGAAALVAQSYGSRQVEIGITSFQMSGLTLNAGTEYTMNVRATEFLQNWSLGQGVFFGINAATNRPGTPSPFGGYTPDLAFNQVQLPLNNDFIEGPYQDLSWTFTPATTLVDPLFVFGTDENDVAAFIDARIRVFSVEVTSGEDTGSIPGCNIADLAEPFGVLDLTDITTFVATFTGGCP